MLSLTATPILQVENPTGSTEVTLVESVVDRFTAETSYYNYDLSVTGGPAVIENLSPEIATVIGFRVIKNPGKSGYATVRANFGGWFKSITLDMRISGGAVRERFSHYVEGTVADKLTDPLMTMLQAGGPTNYYSTFDHSGVGTYIVNPACWAAGIDLSGCPVASTMRAAPNFAHENRGAAVTRRHVIAAKHWNVYTPAYEPGGGMPIGCKLRFVTAGGVVHTRTVIGRAYWNDIILVTLDSGLSPEIIPIPIVGDWFFRSRTYPINSVKGYAGGLCFWLDKFGRVQVLTASSGGGYGEGQTGYYPPVTINGTIYDHALPYQNYIHPSSLFAQGDPDLFPGLQGYFSEGKAEDSGAPVMALVGGSPALINTWHTAVSGPPVYNSSGALINDLIAVSDAMAGVSTGLTVTVAASPV